MESLPVEVIERICSYLCFHCLNPGVFPNTDTEDTRSGKAALARLSRMSIRICAIAQPFVYHYFATGNMPRMDHTKFSDDRFILPAEDDKLPAFLRTVIERPDLAARVRTLQLVRSTKVIDCSSDLLATLIVASKAAGMRHHPLPHVDGGTHDWLEELALVLLPGIEALILARDHPCRFRHLDDCGASLPSLRTVALRGVRRRYYMNEVAALFAAAPGLETLYAMDCDFHEDTLSNPDIKHKDLQLARVARLVVSGLAPDDLWLLVGRFPGLCELQYWFSSHYLDMLQFGELVRALDPVRSTLRRLTLSYSSNSIMSAMYEDMIELDEYDAMPLSRDFAQLEFLAVDQAAIFCPGRWAEGTDDGGTHDPGLRLVDYLPPSIREVHFLSLYRSFPELESWPARPQPGCQTYASS